MRAGLISIRQVLFLVPHADVVTKKSGLCKGCSQPSLFSLRTVADSRTELVGGGEAYQPTCRLCYARGLVHVHTAAAAP
jgi:thymidine kinase